MILESDGYLQFPRCLSGTISVLCLCWRSFKGIFKSQNLLLHLVPLLTCFKVGCEWHGPCSLSALMPFLFLEALGQSLSPTGAACYAALEGIPLKKISWYEWMERLQLCLCCHPEILAQVLLSEAELTQTLREARTNPTKLVKEYPEEGRIWLLVDAFSCFWTALLLTIHPSFEKC